MTIRDPRRVVGFGIVWGFRFGDGRMLWGLGIQGVCRAK